MTAPVEPPLCGATMITPRDTHRCGLSSTDPHAEQVHICRDNDGTQWSGDGPVVPPPPPS